MAELKSSVKVIFGAMTIGTPGVEMTRIHTLDDTAAILDVFQKHGHKEVDTARMYGQGSSEEYLGDLDWQKRGIVMGTKLYPSKGKGQGGFYRVEYDHTPESVRKGLMDSLRALKTDRLDLFYLHAPDRNTPFEDTLREINELHKEGYFNAFGISNYHSWEVSKICEICKKNNWIQPTVYQGLYNAFHRKVEDELFPCLREYGIALYCFNPLAGGFLTSKFQRDTKDSEVEPGGRFDPRRIQGQFHRGRYWNEAMFDALEILRPVAKKYQISESDCGLRWLAHHSQLKQELGDGVIVGASSIKHLEDNLNALDQGPLPDEVLDAINAGWERIRGPPLKFWH